MIGERMGRPKQASFVGSVVLLPNATVTQILGPNPRRVGIVLSPKQEVDIGISWDPTIVDWVGAPIFLGQASPMVITLCCCDYGTILQQPLYASSSDSASLPIGEILSDNPEDWM